MVPSDENPEWFAVSIEHLLFPVISKSIMV